MLDEYNINKVSEAWKIGQANTSVEFQPRISIA